MNTLNFTDDQMQLLNKAIIELPYREAAPMVRSINEQLSMAEKESQDKNEDSDSNN